jgi:hypothetical protein
MEVETQFAERKSSYDKIAVGLEIEKQALEKDCDTYQVSTINQCYYMYACFIYRYTHINLHLVLNNSLKIFIFTSKEYCIILYEV